MDKIFVTSDQHFGHSNIIKYENRPYNNVEEMDSGIISKWNNVVSKNDKVFILGDFSFYNKEKTKEILDLLHGTKILVIGNHDKRSLNFYKDMDIEVVKFPIIYRDKYVMSHEPPTYINDCCPYKYLYGHVHSNDMYKTATHNSACVCVERWDYEPVELDILDKFMKVA